MWRPEYNTEEYKTLLKLLFEHSEIRQKNFEKMYLYHEQTKTISSKSKRVTWLI